MQSNVIHARERFIMRRPSTMTSTPGLIIRPEFGRNTQSYPTKLPVSLKKLPFVKIKHESRRPSAACFWSDAPTANGREDFKRGQTYAALTMAAITADGYAAWYLERILDGIVRDVASRKAKRGRYSRTLPPAVIGFIHELSRQYCARRATD